MATLHLMVGLPCSGKTTRARELEKQYSALRLTPDEWHIQLFGQDYGENMSQAEEARHDARHEAVEALMWNLAARVLALGTDVVLDFGCWAKSERDAFRLRARALGAEFKIHYTEAGVELLLQRVRDRNKQNPQGTFYIPESKIHEWLEVFEPPCPEELG